MIAITLIYLFLQNIYIPEQDKDITKISKKQDEMAKIGKAHKNKRVKYTEMTKNVI